MNKFLTFTILYLVIALTACKKEWLDTSPTDQVDQSVIISTTQNAMVALNGIHRIMWTQYFNQDEAGEGSIHIYMDNLGEDLLNNSSASNTFYQAVYRWDAHRNVNSSVPYFVWFFYYRIIANANLIINNIDAAVGPDTEKQIIKGQALAYRGWAHFNLVQMFGKRYVAGVQNDQLGIPIRLTSSTEPLARSTVEEVYAQVNKDLDEALADLSGYERPAKSHFNANVVKGIKARVALVQQNWPLAAQMAREARQGFRLMNATEYLAGFNDADNPEWMWASKIQNDQGTFFYSYFAFMSSNFSSNATRTNPRSINATLYEQIPATDVRKQLWSPTGVTPPANGTRYPYTSNKFRVVDPSISVGDVVYMRAAEMYLIEAEALARQGKDTEAQNLLYALVTTRNPSYVKSTSTGQTLINEILLQRRIELWGEGFRFLDLKRTNASLDRTGANHNVAIAVTMSVPAGDNRWEWLLPQDEINQNSLAVQNPL